TASALVRHLARTGKPVLAYTIFTASDAHRVRPAASRRRVGSVRLDNDRGRARSTRWLSREFVDVFRHRRKRSGNSDFPHQLVSRVGNVCTGGETWQQTGRSPG